MVQYSFNYHNAKIVSIDWNYSSLSTNCNYLLSASNHELILYLQDEKNKEWKHFRIEKDQIIEKAKFNLYGNNIIVMNADNI